MIRNSPIFPKFPSTLVPFSQIHNHICSDQVRPWGLPVILRCYYEYDSVCVINYPCLIWADFPWFPERSLRNSSSDIKNVDDIENIRKNAYTLLWKHPTSYSLQLILLQLHGWNHWWSLEDIPCEIPIETSFLPCNLDLWSMTLTYNLDLDILPLDLHAEIQVCLSVRLAVRVVTDRRCQNYYTRHVTDVGCNYLLTFSLTCATFSSSSASTLERLRPNITNRRMLILQLLA